jgi:cytochrome c553
MAVGHRGVVAVIYFIARFTSDSTPAYADNVEHFKYGSTGGERLTGIPYSVWMALPGLFPEYLPGGYASLGFIYEPGKDLPIGVSKRRYQGIERVFFNCAICHMGSVRDSPDAPPKYYAGMPSNTVNLRGYYEFMFNIVDDQKFTPQLILARIKNMRIKEDFINRLILRFYAIYKMRESLLTEKQKLAFIIQEPQFGPGRIDTFNPAKALLGFRPDLFPPAEKLGTADFPSIWNQRKRIGMKLHWDGNNTDVDERNRSAAFGTGAYPVSLDRPSLKKTADWLLDAAPPAWPYPLDEAKAARGAQVYAQWCAGCHGKDGKDFAPGQGKIGTVIPIAEIGTDRTYSTPATKASASPISRRPTVMRPCRWMVSGCAPPICTTAAFPPCATCSKTATIGPNSSIAATTCTITTKSDSSVQLPNAMARSSSITKPASRGTPTSVTKARPTARSFRLCQADHGIPAHYEHVRGLPHHHVAHAAR